MSTDHTAEKQRLSDLCDAERRADELFDRVVALLDRFDEIAEAIAFEESGGGIRHGYSGLSIRRLRELLGAVFLQLQGATFGLRDAASRLHAIAAPHFDSRHHVRMVEGYRALAAVAQLALDGFATDDGPDPVDWMRVYSIRDGMLVLHRRAVRDTEEDIRACVAEHDRDLAAWRGCGLGDIADRIERDPQVKRLLTSMRSFLRGPVEELY